MFDFLKTLGGILLVLAIVLILSYFDIGYSLQTV